MSYEICLDYVRTALKRVDHRSYDTRTNATYIERDTIFYSWLLQREEQSVDKQKLVNLVGVDRLERIEDIKDHFMSHLSSEIFAIDMENKLRFTDEMMQAVEDVFD